MTKCRPTTRSKKAIQLVRKRAGLEKINQRTEPNMWCGDAFPIEGVLVATYLLSVEALPHCRCGVANKSCMV